MRRPADPTRPCLWRLRLHYRRRSHASQREDRRRCRRRRVARRRAGAGVQCPKLIAEINNEAGKRFDNVSYDAKLKAAEAQKLHAEGKHAEAEKAAKDALAQLGVKM